MNNHLTMQELEDMGFEVVKSFNLPLHQIQIRRKGLVLVKTSWSMPDGGFEWQNVSFLDTLTKEQLTALDKALNK